MRNTSVFTSSLPVDLLKMLDFYARKFDIPKNNILELALMEYFERVKKAEYVRSFKAAAGDTDQIMLAEEGIENYLKILDE